nr:leucine-rich repeat protein [uncultured Bacteroides sp.]
MKKINTLHTLMIGAAMLLLSACQPADDALSAIAPVENGEDLAGTLIQLDASSFALPDVGTRATATNFPVNGSTMTVGMTVEGATVYTDYTYDGKAWVVDEKEGNKALRWQGNALDHTFIAVSPSRDMSSADFTLPTKYTQDNFSDYDGLLTTTAAVTTKPVKSIAISMEHALVKVTILSSAETVKLTGQTLATTFDATTGALNTVSHAGAMGEITMYKNGPVHLGYILPRTAAERLIYVSSDEKKFPEATDMPRGSNFICSEGVSIITAVAGELKAELEANVGAKVLYITGEMNAGDIVDLYHYCAINAVTELYLDAAGTESISARAFESTANYLIVLEKVSLFRTTDIAERAFVNCAKLTTVDLPNLVILSGPAVFNNCISLKEVNMPNMTTAKGNWMFMGCSSLETIYLPKLDGSCSESTAMFKDCPALKTAILPSLDAMQTGTHFAGTTKALTTLVIKKAEAFSKAAFVSIPTLFVVSDYADADALGTVLTNKQYTGTKAYSNYNKETMTADELIDPANYSVTWSAVP